MPALPSVNDAIAVTYDFTIGADTLARCRQFFGIHPSSGTGLTNAQAAAMATAISSSYGTNLKTLARGSTSLTSVKVTGLTSPTDGFGEDATVIAGTRTGNQLSASQAILQSLHLERRYRGGHPRTYWPFGTDGDLDTPQLWEPTFVTAVGTGLDNHFTDWSTDLPSGITNVFPINISYYQGFTPITGSTGRVRNVSKPRLSPIVDLILSFAIQQGIANIRKRLLRLA